MQHATGQFFTPTTLVGMLHIPINTILAAPARWRDGLKLPSPTRDDLEIIASSFRFQEQGALWHDDFPSLSGNLAEIDELSARCRQLSFFRLLQDRALAEAKLYIQHGFGAVLVENVAAPYFTRREHPLAIYGVIDAISQSVREELDKCKVGIQVIAFGDSWAMDIAVRRHLDFIRCESALFGGVRPEGPTPNRGNLAKLYMARSQLMSDMNTQGDGPQVFVDVQKKHTVFMREFDSLDLWLENILFQKLEGIIITGEATGQMVEEDDIRKARCAIESAKERSLATVGSAWSSQLIIGSGACVENISTCKQYADAVIVGSALKKNGYWENPVDIDRVKRFMEAWNA